MKKIKKSICLIVFIISLHSKLFAGGVPVIDFSNLIQNLRNTISTIVQEAKSTVQLKQQLKQLETMYDNLKKLQIALNDPDISSLIQNEDIFLNSSGLSYNIDAIQNEYDQIYNSYKENIQKHAELTSNYQHRIDQANKSVLDSLKAQASIQQLSQDREEVNKIIDKSRGASGNLEALQAVNELNVVLIKQLMRLESMFAGFSRLQSEEYGNKISNQKIHYQRNNFFHRDSHKISNEKPLNDLP